MRKLGSADPPRMLDCGHPLTKEVVIHYRHPSSGSVTHTIHSCEDCIPLSADCEVVEKFRSTEAQFERNRLNQNRYNQKRREQSIQRQQAKTLQVDNQAG